MTQVPANGDKGQEINVGRAFDLKMAAVFAALIGLIVLVAAELNAWLGARGMLLGAAVTGLIDAHATAASAASLTAANKISTDQAVGPILVGLSTNTIMKAVVSFKSGGVRYAAHIVPGLALMIIASLGRSMDRQLSKHRKLPLTPVSFVSNGSPSAMTTLNV